MKLAFFDIDGTLAIGTDVPKSAQEAISKLRENGNKVFICTGRPLNYVIDNFSQYADGFITNNGRIAYLNGEIIYRAPLSNEQREDIINKLTITNSNCLFVSETELYYYGDMEKKEAVESYIGKVEDFSEYDGVIYSFDIWINDNEDRNYIEEVFGSDYVMNWHGPMPSADVSVTGSNKGDAIIAVSKILNIPIEDTYAFGDGTNDIVMLKEAGNSIAMGNAYEEVKAVADYITTDILDDGIKKALEHYGLI